MPEKPIVICSRGSALALAQANAVIAQCRTAFPRLTFELRIIKTTGDKLQTAAMAKGELPKGLFTKELEVALVESRADLAVHSLKDLPTELPPGLTLGAVGEREDVRDVLIYRGAALRQQRSANANSAETPAAKPARRGFSPGLLPGKLPAGAVVATSSTRRKASLLAANPALKVVDIRGNVPTRLLKVSEREDLDATILAMAGMKRLNFAVTPDGGLTGDAVPDGLLATPIPVEQMLPCVGQAAIGIEIRENDERIVTICQRLNHFNTLQCVTAERAFLAAMGGGCQSPVGAHAEVEGERLHLRAVSFLDGCRHAEATGPLKEPVKLGEDIAAKLKG